MWFCFKVDGKNHCEEEYVMRYRENMNLKLTARKLSEQCTDMKIRQMIIKKSEEQTDPHFFFVHSFTLTQLAF